MESRDLVGDGTRGVPDRAPFDAIAVHATAPAPPASLLAQLEGRPDGDPDRSRTAGSSTCLTLLRKGVSTAPGEASVIAPCRFVPLVGEEGFSDR